LTLTLTYGTTSRWHCCRCSCTSRYYGDRCEELDACHSSPCIGAGSVCVNVPPASFRCHCAPGSYGRLCESADPCADRPCRHGGTCVIVDQSASSSPRQSHPSLATRSDLSDRRVWYVSNCLLTES